MNNMSEHTRNIIIAVRAAKLVKNAGCMPYQQDIAFNACIKALNNGHSAASAIDIGRKAGMGVI